MYGCVRSVLTRVLSLYVHVRLACAWVGVTRERRLWVGQRVTAAVCQGNPGSASELRSPSDKRSGVSS